MNEKKFVIIDAHALAYKAYFAFISRPLITKKGEPTSAVYGFMTQLLRILEEIKPNYLAVAFDSKEKTFRHERYEAYKSTRAVMPEDMPKQIERIKEIISALKIPVYQVPRYEADDIIGTAVKKCEKENFISYMITPDKDYVQLISEKTFLVKPGKSTDQLEFYDIKRVIDEYGFHPDYMIDYLALVGDSSDVIPGVAGIGPKTAAPLIKQFGTIENIYENLDKISSKSVVNKLEQNKENAFLSKELATIHLNVPLELDLNKTIIESPDFESLKNLFIELEFKTLYGRLLKIFSGEKSDNDKTVEVKEENIEDSVNNDVLTFDKSKVKYQLVTKTSEAKKLEIILAESSEFVFDTETDSLDIFNLKLAGVSFAIKEGQAWFVAINPFIENTGLFEVNISDRLSLNDFISIFKNVFENNSIRKICQNGKFDIAVLRTLGIQVNNFYFDTMVASYVIDPDQNHGMDDLSLKYLNYKPIPLSELIGTKKDPSRIFETDINLLSNYSAEDADVTFRLYKILKKEIEKNNLHKVAYEIDFPLIEVLEDMERTGVSIDNNILNELRKKLNNLLEDYTQKIYETAGENFNLNSPQQLQVILFDKLKLTRGRKTKTGFSTDAKALEALMGEHPIIQLILDYRQAAKLKSTYVDALPQLVNKKTGRVHTSFNQTVASTGRLSSNDPNLQNIPIRTELGKEIRKAFVPRNDDYLILSADYSQIELRIMASICEDKTLIEAFNNNEDIHRRTAALVFMVPIDDVTPEMRRKAKEVNFGILYGIGPFGLKSRLGVSQQHASDIIKTYFSTFKNVKKFMDDSISDAKKNGFAQTLTGRRRFLRNINSKNGAVRQFEERVAINMPIQGTAADMIKLAMINIHNELKKRNAKTKMILQVHDELVFEVHKSELDEVKPLIKSLMENAMPMNVPILVDTGIGSNWLEAH